jgi:acetyltransferase (GNAT) family protein
MLYLVFHLTGAALLANRASREDAAPRRLPPGYSLETWKPGRGRILPPTLGLKFALWWLLHVFGIFRNPNYTVLIVRRNGRAVHRTCLIPKYFRWPFMSDNDLQVSSTWTHSSHRCLGIATCVLQHVVEEWSKEGRTLWYVTHADNAASIAVCCHMGFRMKTAASRTSRLGIRLLGELALLDGSANKPASLGALSGQALPAPGYKAPSISADSGAK